MGKKSKTFKRDLDKQAITWFNQTDDELPFSAFGDADKENKIKADIFNQINQQVNHKSLKLVMMKVAAVLLLATTIGIMFFGDFSQKSTAATAQSWTTHHTDLDVTKTITLADGSVVVLRAGAQLSVPETFTSDTKRLVKLEGGEAYFTVKSNPKRPFIVQSGQVSTTVLGTAFNIRNRTSVKEVEIAVSHGKVQVNDQNQHLADLTKGKVIRYHTESNSFKLDSVNANYVASWNSTALDLNDVAFKELAYVFDSYYETELMAADADIAKLRYTLTISKAASAQSTLNIIAKIHGLFIKKQNGKLILYK